MAPRMGSKGIKQVILIWVVLSLTGLTKSQNIPNITNFSCFNDFINKLFCFWEIVGSSSNCTEDFALKYSDNKHEKGELCPDLHNEQSGGAVLPNKCICNMNVSLIVISDIYYINVELRGQLVASKVIYIKSTIKPRAPSNVRVDFQEESNVLVQWDTGYDNFMRQSLSFHVQILFQRQRNVAKEDFITRLEPRYQFSKRQLQRGEDYVVRVRTKGSEALEFNGTWSEWSPEVGWRNDYRLTILDLQNIIIPITCIVILCLVIMSYICLSRLKRKWWNNIPNPAKSKLAQSQLLQKQVLNPDEKTVTQKSCESFLSRIVKVHKSKCDQLIQQQNSKDYVNIRYDYKKVVFDLKDEDIETCIKMYPKHENEDLVQEDLKQNAEDLLLDGDLSISKMFFDILCDSTGGNVDTFNNLNTWTSLGWIDSFGEKDTQRCNSVSTYRQSGYNSYGSERSPLFFFSSVDGLKNVYFSQCFDNESECSPSLNHTLIPGNSICPNSLSNIFLYKNNSCESLLTQQSNPYYNTKYFFLHNPEDRCQSVLRPEENTEMGFQCYESKSGPSSICHLSNCQAIENNDPCFECFTSGYKSFDQAVQESRPDSVCQVSGYQGFDQARQQGDVTSVCQVNGYQSFEQAVQQNEEGSNCTVVEQMCKPSEDIIFRTRDYLVNDMSENDGQYELRKSQCQNKADSPLTEKFNHLTDCRNKETIISNQKQELLFSDVTQFLLEDLDNSTKEAYQPSKDFSDKRVPFTLTFDICEHLRNLENMHGHKVSLNSLIFPCHLNDVQFVQQQLTLNKYLTSQKCCPTKSDNFENFAYFAPSCDLEGLKNKHFLVQQSNVDKDGNSYMKLGLPRQDN